MPRARIFPVTRLELGFASWRWPFAEKYRAEIDLHFEGMCAASPALWNGRVLLMREAAVTGDVLHGTFFETGFAEFMASRDWGWPDCSVYNCFAMAVLRSSDRAYLLGVMGSQTVSAGKIYFPCGTPEPGDRCGERVDLLANLMRETTEETGLTTDDFEMAPGWDVVFDEPFIAVMKRIAVPLPAETLRHKIQAYLAREAQPELADMHIVRSPTDFHPMMPTFVTAYLAHLWKTEASAPID